MTVGQAVALWAGFRFDNKLEYLYVDDRDNKHPNTIEDHFGQPPRQGRRYQSTLQALAVKGLNLKHKSCWMLMAMRPSPTIPSSHPASLFTLSLSLLCDPLELSEASTATLKCCICLGHVSLSRRLSSVVLVSPRNSDGLEQQRRGAKGGAAAARFPHRALSCKRCGGAVHRPFSSGSCVKEHDLELGLGSESPFSTPEYFMISMFV